MRTASFVVLLGGVMLGCGGTGPSRVGCPEHLSCSASPVTLADGAVCGCEPDGLDASQLDAAADGGLARSEDGSCATIGSCTILGQTWDEATCSCAVCVLAEHVSDYVPQTGTHDCGSLAIDADPSVRTSAQHCVTDALAAGQPFRLIEARRGTDSAISKGYAYGGAHDLVAIYSYDGDPSGGSNAGAVIDAVFCRGLLVDATCQPSDSDDCLRCDQQVAAGRVCDGRAGQERANCNGPGNYEAGKEGSYRPCCQGLNERITLVAEFSDQGAQCAQAIGYRSYACIAGSCGDGFCEATEAVPCNCPVDCPSAVLGGDAGTLQSTP